jgi:hypothetical protein
MVSSLTWRLLRIAFSHHREVVNLPHANSSDGRELPDLQTHIGEARLQRCMACLETRASLSTVLHTSSRRQHLEESVPFSGMDRRRNNRDQTKDLEVFGRTSENALVITYSEYHLMGAGGMGIGERRAERKSRGKNI